MPHETPRTCSARANDDTNRLFTLMYKYTSGRVQRPGGSPPATNPNLVLSGRLTAHDLPNELRPHRHPSHA